MLALARAGPWLPCGGVDHLSIRSSASSAAANALGRSCGRLCPTSLRTRCVHGPWNIPDCAMALSALPRDPATTLTVGTVMGGNRVNF